MHRKLDRIINVLGTLTKDIQDIKQEIGIIKQNKDEKENDKGEKLISIEHY